MTLQPDCLSNMTEVEVSLIALNLQFKKMFRLPKSQWAQLRDRVINVPIDPINLQSTIEKLPRNPSDSGLIGVNWKRKLSFKNTHKREFVDINRVFDAIEYLIKNHSSYRSANINTDFLTTCKSTDPLGHAFFIAPNEVEHSLDSQMNSDDDELFMQISSQHPGSRKSP